MEYIESLLNLFHANYWISQLFAVILITFIVNRSANKVLKKLQIKFEKTSSSRDNILAKSIKNPLSFVILIIGLTILIQIIQQRYDIAILQKASSLIDIGIIASIGWFAIRFIKETKAALLSTKGKTKSKIDRSTVGAVTTILNVAVIIITALMLLQTLGVQIGGILALGGVGGIAIGFAAKDLLSNFFGGLMIYFDRPFKVGDWIRSPDKEIEGTVVKIGWRQTQIKTFTHRPLYIPNSVFSVITVENPSRMTNRRIYETIGVRYDDIDKLEKIVNDTKDMFHKHGEIDQKETIIVNVDSFAASSVDFFIYAATNTTNWVKYHEIKQDILLKVAKIISDNKAEIAFPTSTIHLPKNPDSYQG
jgi:MscS family membrane protein